MSSELAKNNMELDTPLKKRLYQLMTDDEKLLPFSFANRIGISKSTFHSIWTKGSTSIHRGTAKKIADATGVDIDWLHKGVGVPYPDEGRIVQPSDGT
jgi:transcriptional regulator with XRE-family HTH domain